MAPKRPSSGRRSITQETFTSSASCARLRTVQNLLNPPSGSKDKHPEAILCILGIDSRYNEGCRELANYLLFSMFDIRRDELENSGFDEEVIDDLIFVIKADSVHVYCNPVNYPYILPYIAHWPNLRLHCMTEKQYEDEEAAQEFKITSFLDIVKESHVIGVPYSARGHKVAFDSMTLEKWPLIQAHGLEDFAMGGFFTMVHEVLDLSEALVEIFAGIDAVAMESLVTEQLPLFERQWNAMVSNLDVACKDHNHFKQLSQVAVMEPLKSYYNHGRVSSPRSDKRSTQRRPFVLFGQESSKLEAQDDQQITVGKAGIGGRHAKHMVCQAISARSPLACARTYFLSIGHTPLPVTGATVQAPRAPKTDQELLSRLYVVVIDAVLMAIQAFVDSNSFTEAHTVAMDTLKTGCKENLLPNSLYSSRDTVEFTMDYLDIHGQSVPMEDNQAKGLVKMIGLRVVNIGSLEHSGNTLGSVVFAESFLDSRLLVAHADERKSLDNQCLILTSQVPRYITWAGDMKKDTPRSIIGTFTKEPLPLGKVLVDGETALNLGSSKLSSVHEGLMYICERGILFNHARHGVVIFPKSHFEELQFYDGESAGSTGMLVVTYRRSLCHYLPTEYHSDEDMVMFTFSPRTKLHKAFYSEVLSVWQNSSESPPLKIVNKAPKYYEAVYNELHNRYNTDHKLQAISKPLHTAGNHLPQLASFVEHFSASSVCQLPIPQSDVKAVLRQSNEPTEANDETIPVQTNTEVVVTIVSGVPGSQKENLCKILTNMAKEQSRWVTLKPTLESTDGFTVESIQSSLTAVIAATKKKGVRAATGGRKKMRVLVVTPGYADTVHVYHAIASHPDPEVARQIRIGAVTVCIDPHNTFIVNRLTHPRLLDHCMQGWVNNVLFTNSTTGPDPELQSCQELIRRVNPQVAFILASNGQITRSGDIDMILSETSFMTPDLIRARHLMTPGWWLGCISGTRLYPAIHEVCIKFYQPLEKNKLLAKLRTLKASLCARPMKGNIYNIRGRLKFTDCDQVMEIQFVTLSQHLSLTAATESPSARPPVRPQPPSGMSNGDVANGPNGDSNGAVYCIVFTGCELQETDLKEWLRTCARQKPVKKSLQTKSTLTKQELGTLQTKHHLEPLPQGWFYNGHQYVSLGGDRSNQHPDMDKFISDYLECINTGIGLYNDKVDAHKYLDLFQETH